ncbi:TolC family protein [Singulisphaera sp. PoT]|uniref:TolC family protein n=1 Tax=Singulisphaera sp. PoT TaxID=3411797 RepID=UPI003BF4C55D
MILEGFGGGGVGRTTCYLRWAGLGGLLLVATATAAQDPGTPSSGKLIERPDLGPMPGSLDPVMPTSPGALQQAPSSLSTGIIGGSRRGLGRIPRPGARGFSRSGVQGPAALPDPLPGLAPPNEKDDAPAGDVGDLVDDDGPADGMSLDQAIERMRVANLDVLAIQYELPQAQADILTAGLRNNPLIYGDAQFIPYGAFNQQRPGGPTQYDVNITYPLDVSRKRKSRVEVACAAKRVLEAQFQDVARRQISNLYRAFVDLQSARISLLALERMVGSEDRLLERIHRRGLPKKPTPYEDDRLIIELGESRAGLDDARDALADAQEALALLLSLPEEQVAGLHLKGRLRLPAPPLPPLEELIRDAKAYRPDLNAARLGIRRADSEIRLARANRLDDVYLFYDPFSYQDNHPFQSLSGKSWGVGLTVPLPVFNRNQGNIAKARSNHSQSQVECAALERRVAAEVRQAYREFAAAKQALELVERTVLGRARDARKRALEGLKSGELEVGDYLDHLKDDADSSRMYRDAVLRYRRSMLDLNTAVGARIMP